MHSRRRRHRHDGRRRRRWSGLSRRSLTNRRLCCEHRRTPLSSKQRRGRYRDRRRQRRSEILLDHPITPRLLRSTRSEQTAGPGIRNIGDARRQHRRTPRRPADPASRAVLSLDATCDLESAEGQPRRCRSSRLHPGSRPDGATRPTNSITSILVPADRCLADGLLSRSAAARPTRSRRSSFAGFADVIQGKIVGRSRLRVWRRRAGRSCAVRSTRSRR
ncbi:MAG: hypothetical protein MZU97_20690 [Bacillus subtilis]|nr:hypothetical protein [Bacillus subtilis]